MKTMTNTTKVKKVWSCIGHNKEYNFFSGSVFTPLGIVDVYSQGDRFSPERTFMRFVHNGRIYHRSIDKRYTRRGLSIIANRFINELYR